MKKIKQDKQRIAVVTIAMFILVVTIFATAKINKRFENQISLPNKSVSFDSEKILYCHFSIDDSNSIFEDLTENEKNYNRKPFYTEKD